jgi:hypothetical protein
MTQIVPITFQGISSGKAMMTSVAEIAHPPLRGMVRAIATPSGSSINSTSPENTNWRSNAF